MIVEWSLRKLNPYNLNPQQLEPPAISNLFNSAILTNFSLGDLNLSDSSRRLKLLDTAVE